MAWFLNLQFTSLLLILKNMRRWWKKMCWRKELEWFRILRPILCQKRLKSRIYIESIYPEAGKYETRREFFIFLSHMQNHIMNETEVLAKKEELKNILKILNNLVLYKHLVSIKYIKKKQNTWNWGLWMIGVVPFLCNSTLLTWESLKKILLTILVKMAFRYTFKRMKNLIILLINRIFWFLSQNCFQFVLF